ncbi:MAG TPA: AMP-binding protein [Candidatus Polarisedimenticolaceae bacterium]|nr:AMP-binding protein [Candidatus Polarisedimenticolaceae bacterium]
MERSVVATLLERLDLDPPPNVRAHAPGGWGPKPGFGRDAAALAGALLHYGLAAGQRVAVLGPAGTEWLQAGLAALLAGGTLVPLEGSLSDEIIRKALETTEAVQALAVDERQLARLLAMRPDLPRLELVILLTAAPSERKPAALTAESAASVGREHLSRHPDCLKVGISAASRGDACVFINSEGRASTVSASSLTRASSRIVDAIEARPGRSLLSTLRLARYEGLALAIGSLARGVTLYVGNPDDLADTDLSRNPVDAVVLSERSLTQLFQAWNKDLETRSALKRAVARWALRQGRSRQASPWKRRLADRLVLKKLRRRLGGRVTRLDVITPIRRDLSPDVKAFFESVGLPVRTHRLDGESPLAR